MSDFWINVTLVAGVPVTCLLAGAIGFWRDMNDPKWYRDVD